MPPGSGHTLPRVTSKFTPLTSTSPRLSCSANPAANSGNFRRKILPFLSDSMTAAVPRGGRGAPRGGFSRNWRVPSLFRARSRRDTDSDERAECFRGPGRAALARNPPTARHRPPVIDSSIRGRGNEVIDPSGWRSFSTNRICSVLRRF